jgi:hypothetical protein
MKREYEEDGKERVRGRWDGSKRIYGGKVETKGGRKREGPGAYR